MLQNWFYKSGEGLLAVLWTGHALKVALMKPTFVPNPDTQVVWGDISAQEVAGTGYTAGGIALANKTQVYNPGADRTDLDADDVSWGPGATFDAAFAVVYDSGAPASLWSLVDFQGTKSVVNGVFTINWAAAGILYLSP